MLCTLQKWEQLRARSGLQLHWKVSTALVARRSSQHVSRHHKSALDRPEDPPSLLKGSRLPFGLVPLAGKECYRRLATQSTTHHSRTYRVHDMHPAVQYRRLGHSFVDKTTGRVVSLVGC